MIKRDKMMTRATVPKEVSRLAADVLAKSERICQALWDKNVAPRRLASQRFTFLGLSVALEHAGEAIRCFRGGRRYVALSMDRCFYEAMVRTLEWLSDPELARRHWSALPPAAAHETALSVDRDESQIPAGVRRDREKYREQHPEAFKVKPLNFSEARAVLTRVYGLSQSQLLSDKTVHVDNPSLVVHCRPLIAEDFFEVTDEGIDRRAESLWVNAGPRVLELTRLLLLLLEAVIEGFTLAVETQPLWRRYYVLAGLPLPESLQNKTSRIMAR